MNISFQFPYTSRIVGRLPGHEPIELFRPAVAGAKLEQSQINFVTRSLDPAWESWVEHHTPQTHLIGGRPIPKRPGPNADPTSNGKGGIRLTFSEIQRINNDSPRLTHWT